MKREGRQHGVVRTSMILPWRCNPRPTDQFVNWFDSPAFGVFIKVPSKPTRAKCSNCHAPPATGYQADKSKGRRKLQATTWWAEDKLDRLGKSESSSARSLVHKLCGEDYDGHVYDHDTY